MPLWIGKGTEWITKNSFMGVVYLHENGSKAYIA